MAGAWQLQYRRRKVDIMKLSDQIALLRETLPDADEYMLDGESVGEAAVRLIGELYQERAEQFVAMRAAQQERDDALSALKFANPKSDGLCDSCHYLDNSKHVPRLCMNPEAWRQGFSRRGYSVAAWHACEEWTG